MARPLLSGRRVAISASGPREPRRVRQALSVDQHGIEPIPDADRDSTAWQQFWIWFGANISPLQWVAGAMGPQLGLSLIQSIVIIVVGQALGALIDRERRRAPGSWYLHWLA